MLAQKFEQLLTEWNGEDNEVEGKEGVCIKHPQER